MRFVKRLLYGLLAVAALVLLAGLFLPRSAHVERSVTSSAPPAAVYELVNGFQRFNEWSPWFGMDPQARYTYAGPATGVGARMTWSSDQPGVGSGSQEIVAVEPGRQVVTRLDFGSQGVSTSTITILPEGRGSRITWAFDADFANDYFGRYFGPLMDRFVGPDYEKGLARLKALAEATPAAR